MARMRTPELKPFTGMVAGRYHYYDAFEGAPPQLAYVTYELGDCIATFLEAEPEDGEVTMLTRDMAGRFERI